MGLIIKASYAPTAQTRAALRGGTWVLPPLPLPSLLSSISLGLFSVLGWSGCHPLSWSPSSYCKTTC